MLVPPVATETATEAATVAPPPVDQAAALKAFFEEYDQAELALSPISKAYRAIKDQDYGKLDEFTDAAAIRNRELDQRTVDEMARRFDRADALGRGPAELRPAAISQPALGQHLPLSPLRAMCSTR